MARFTIYSPTGVALYEGTPTFTGQYMKPGLLEFREVALPNLVELVPGCYVDYTRVTDTVNGVEVPRRYRVYSVPQLKKQARSNTYGGAFVYQSVQLYDASKMLEYCPFRDLVAGDNRIHFSTQPSISTFEGCDGLAARFESCLRDQYDENGVQSWRVRTATSTDGASQDLLDLMADARDFTVSGVNILECLDKVYEIWPEVGWIYTVERINGVPTNTIIIGGAGLNANQGTYAYGKGKGLKSLTRTAANVDEMANRIYAYGSSRNMLPGWYNSQDIKDAESVDIQNLMIPVSEWGLTNGERDAAKAYVEDSGSITRIGLRPATVYFDGTGEYPEIYPTIRNKTIGNLWEVMSSSDQYYPNPSKYESGDRIDTLLSAQSVFDSGLAGNTPGKANVEMGDTPFSASGSFEMLAGLTYYPFYHYQGGWSPETAGIQTIAWRLDLSGYVQLDGVEKAVVSVQVKDPSYQGPIILTSEYELTPDGSGVITFSGKDMYAEKVNVSAVSYTVFVDISIYMTAQATDKTGTYTANGNVGFALQNYRKKTFTISLRQLGFDINEQSAIGDGKTIAMRSGDCVGRSFAIKSVQYKSATDSWELECWRSEDESLSQWFPNSQYGVAAGDEFVLLDIAMPSLYISMAENELYQAAQDLLLDTATERWQYIPEIDAKYMVENSRTIRCGEYMAIIDPNIIIDGIDNFVYFRTSEGGYFLTINGERIIVDGGILTTVLVDTIVINEGEAAIPTYKVTLRDRKRKVWTESKGAESPSSKSVGGITAQQSTQESSSSSESKYFTLDENGNITLKPQYQNLWVPGWMAAGGVGTEGGGGGVSFLKELGDVYHDEYGVLRANGSDAVVGDALVYSGPTLGWVAAAQSGGISSVVLSAGSANGTLKLTVNGVAGSDVSVPGLGSFAYKNSLSASDIPSLSYLPLSGGELSGDLRLKGSSNYGRTIRFGDGDYAYIKEDADDHLKIYGDKGIELSTGSGYDVTINGVPLDWFTVVTVDGSPTLRLNSRYAGLWADGWVSAGGVGSGSGGGVSSLYALDEVLSTTNPSTNQVFYFNGSKWTAISLKTVNYNSLLGSGNINIQGGGISSVSLASGTNNGTLKLTVDGTVTDNIAVKGLGSLAYKSSLSASDIPTLAYLPLTGGELSGDLRLKGAANYGRTLRFGDGDYAYLSEDTDDHLSIFADRGITLSANSGYGIETDNYIDIGNARLIFDEGTNALHVTKKSGTSETIGLFADGFVAAGGVSGQTTMSYVDLESDQTIGGNKTFTGTTTLGNVTGPITLSGALNGLSIIKDSNNYVSLRASRIDIQDNGNNLFLCRGSGKVFLCANPGGTVSQKLYLDSSSTAIAQAWNTHSDIRLKEDIETVSKAEAIEKVMALNPVRWRWKSGGLSAGLIAQEVEKVLPFMVTDGEYKGLAYQMLHAYEVSAIQSHEERIKVLEKKVKTMEG